MKSRSSIPLVLSLAAIFAPAVLRAQASATADNLEEVTVFSKRFVPPVAGSGSKTDTPPIELPVSLSVISRDLLDSWNAGKLTEALRYTPGINAEPFGLEPRFANIIMRGFTALATGNYRDGLALVNPSSAVSYNPEPYGAERIEIPRGPASVLYGRASPGGIVNYVSKAPKKIAFGEIGLEAGNYSRKKAEVDVGTPIGESFGVRFVGLVQNGDTQVDFIQDDRRYAALSGRWDITERTSLTVFGSYQFDKAKDSQAIPADGFLTPNPNGVIPLSIFTGEPGIDDYHRNEGSGGYIFEHKFSDSLRFAQNARFNHVSTTEQVIYSNGLLPDRRTVTRAGFWGYGALDGTAVDNQLHWNLGSGFLTHKLLGGVDYQDVHADRTTHSQLAPITLDVFNPMYGTPIVKPAAGVRDELSIKQLGFYLQDEMKFNEKLIVSLGVRYDDVKLETFSLILNRKTQDQKENNVTKRVGLVYLTDAGFAPYVSYAESFLPSTGLTPAGLPFEPEEGKQIEVGVKFQPKSFNGLFTIAAFDLKRKNFVSRSQTTLLLEQTGEGQSRGIEFEAFSELKNGLSYIMSYTYLDTEQTVNADRRLIGKTFTQTPKHKAGVWLDYNFDGFGLPNFGVGAGGRYQSSTFSDTFNTITSPGYTLVDAAAHYTWNNMRFSINVQNVANKEFVSSCFTRNSLLCTAGEARSIKATVRYRW